MKNIPNLFTLLNLIFGCAAIVFTLQTQSVQIYTNDEFTSSFNIPENLSIAALLLYAAAVVDFFDGFVARLFNASSEMGKQLDSLADVVSFGVAPGAIIYQLLRMSYMREENGLDISIWLLMPAFILSAASAFRLAKFNISTTQSYGFIGVPTPAVGLLVASFPLILHFGTGQLNVSQWLVNKWVLYAAIAVLSWLMVSNLPMIALKFKNKDIKSNMDKIILLVIGVVAALLFKWLAVPIIFVAYIILSLANKNKSTT